MDGGPKSEYAIRAIPVSAGEGRIVDKSTRNFIERATQRARRILEEDFAAQLEGTYDILQSGEIAAVGGPHLSPQQRIWREKIVAAIEHKRAAGMEPAEAVAGYKEFCGLAPGVPLLPNGTGY